MQMQGMIDAELELPRRSEMTPEQMRMLPMAVKVRAEDAQRIWGAVAKVKNGDKEALFEFAIIALAARQLAKPEHTSLCADHAEAARIREAIKGLGLGLVGKWDKALSLDRARQREERAYLKKTFSPPRQEALVPVSYEKDGQSAIKWGTQPGNTDPEEMLSRMNGEHAVVPGPGGALRYLHETTDWKGNKELRLLRREDFHGLYAHISYPVDGKRPTASQVWERWPDRRQYAGMGMFPGSEVFPAKVPPDYLNLWKGFAVEPKKGDWSRFYTHLLKKVCQGNEAHCDWLLDWLAHLVQKPQEKPGTCVVLKSAEEGTGKSMLAKFLMDIFGEHAVSVSKSEQIVGKFNGHLLQNVLLVAEEALWAGDKDAEGVLKDLITGGVITVEKKGLDVVSAPSFTRLLVITNNAWAVPVGEDPRRFFVLKVENARANDPKYFGPIWRQMDQDGGTAAMLHYLLNERDVDANQLRFAPATDGLAEQREQSLSAVERWLVDVAASGSIRIVATNERKALSTKDETVLSSDDVRDAALRACLSETRNTDRALGPLLKKVGVTKTRTPRPRRDPAYIFPDAPTFRANVAKALGVAIVDEYGIGAEGPTIH